MVPIHDTDLAEERWNLNQWQHYELWEKLEYRGRLRKRLWIGITIFLFMGISSVPTIRDRWPKWKTRVAARALGQELNRLKREAAISQHARRIVFMPGPGLRYQVEESESCTSEKKQEIRTGALLEGAVAGEYLVLNEAEAKQLNLPGATLSFCFDPLQGGDGLANPESVRAFVIAPVMDLAASRPDRITVLLMSGAGVDLSFD